MKMILTYLNDLVWSNNSWSNITSDVCHYANSNMAVTSPLSLAANYLN